MRLGLGLCGPKLMSHAHFFAESAAVFCGNPVVWPARLSFPSNSCAHTEKGSLAKVNFKYQLTKSYMTFNDN